jgi:hypothetical protein
MGKEGKGSREILDKMSPVIKKNKIVEIMGMKPFPSKYIQIKELTTNESLS